MDTKIRLRAEVAANLAAAMEQCGQAQIYFNGFARHSPPLQEQRRTASELIIPSMRQAGCCQAFAYKNETSNPAPIFRDTLISAGKRRTEVRLELPDECLFDLLVGTRARRPTLVWSLGTREECFTQLLNKSFDPLVLTNPRTISSPSAIRFARENAASDPDHVWLVLPSNQHLSGCLLYFQKSRAREMLTFLLDHVQFSTHYIRMYC
jgi:hypothetical protein